MSCVVKGCTAPVVATLSTAPAEIFGAEESARWPSFTVCETHYAEWGTAVISGDWACAPEDLG